MADTTTIGTWGLFGDTTDRIASIGTWGFWDEVVEDYVTLSVESVSITDYDVDVLITDYDVSVSVTDYDVSITSKNRIV